MPSPSLQVYLLNRRFQQHQQIIWQGHGGVQDRTIYEDSVFARVLKESGMMEEREYETYVSLFSNMSNFMWVKFLGMMTVKWLRGKINLP